jgi:hypothetical protein
LRPVTTNRRAQPERRNMKKKLFALIVALSFVVSLIAPTFAYAFTVRIRADIPFDFMVGKRRLPKGEYIIETLNDSTLTIRNAKKGKAISFMTVKGKMMEKPKSKLVFHRYNDQYFLARIWDGSSDTILKLNKSNTEKRVAKLAKKEENPDEVPVSDK